MNVNTTTERSIAKNNKVTHDFTPCGLALFDSRWHKAYKMDGGENGLTYRRWHGRFYVIRNAEAFRAC